MNTHEHAMPKRDLYASHTATLVPTVPLMNLGTFVPTVGSDFLQGVPEGFVRFIQDRGCEPFIDGLIGCNNPAAFMLKDIRQKVRVGAGARQPAHFFRVVEQIEANAETRKQFKRWIRDVWFPARGNPDGRGPAFWLRIGAMLWSLYQGTLDLRKRAEIAVEQEVKRIENHEKRREDKKQKARIWRRERKVGVPG
jgi:hypothetical protein